MNKYRVNKVHFKLPFTYRVKFLSSMIFKTENKQLYVWGYIMSQLTQYLFSWVCRFNCGKSTLQCKKSNCVWMRETFLCWLNWVLWNQNGHRCFYFRSSTQLIMVCTPSQVVSSPYAPCVNCRCLKVVTWPKQRSRNRCLDQETRSDHLSTSQVY